MLAAMVATAILVTPIEIALIPAPTDSSAGFPQVERPSVPQELEWNVKRQASARRAAELTKLLTLAESPDSTTGGSSSAAADAFDGGTSPQIKSAETPNVDFSPETMNANARPEAGATVVEVEPATEPTTVTPRARSMRSRLHARRRIRLTRGAAPPAATLSNANTSVTGAGSVEPPASGPSRESVF
jgi:hypothetical protein